MSSKQPKQKLHRGFRLAAAILLLALCLSIGQMAYDGHWIECGVTAVLTLIALALALASLTNISDRMSRRLTKIARRLSPTDQQALEASPFAILSIAETGEILWYNRRFAETVLDGKSAVGDSALNLLAGTTLAELEADGRADVAVGDRRYTVLASKLTMDKVSSYLLYYWDDTDFKETADEYRQSRPVVLSVYIDNLDELLPAVRDSERVQIIGRVETLLEDWIGSTTGMICKSESGRFLAVAERRHVDEMAEARFPILDQVRNLQIGDVTGLTLSIGVGEGEHLHDSVSLAQQAIEMALGRGGDQAAVHTAGGFEFYGGATKDVERRTRVRSRMVASAMKDVITASDKVILMGHRYADADCFGATMALAAAARTLGKPAFVAIDRERMLAPECLSRYTAEEQSEWLIDEKTARDKMTSQSLLLVCDTHNAAMLEFPSVCSPARRVVVIDHHRKMVEHIENALIFYDEPYAGSTCEMVTELLGYMTPNSLVRREAEGLLAGIVLDTHNFVLKSGVRTFEAAAMLKRAGADTVSVKKMLSGSMDLYRAKTEILSHAEVRDGIALSCAPGGGKEQRLAAAQAADELLSIQDVEAAFVLLPDGEDVNISARSYGEFNVHLTMEALGGGGHMTMAGTRLEGVSLDTAKQYLMDVIVRQRAEAAARSAE